MALSKQAKILSKKQVDSLLWYVRTLRNGLRNQTIVLLSVRAGLRAKEIAGLKWAMITDAEGNISDSINLTDEASKGRGGRIIPLNMKLRHQLEDLLEQEAQRHQFDVGTSYVISTERAGKTSAQAIVNMFSAWYVDMGLMGCSSHSGRRTFITNAARQITTVGGSLRDVQMLAGHSSLAVTQRYIEADSDSQRRIVELI